MLLSATLIIASLRRAPCGVPEVGELRRLEAQLHPARPSGPRGKARPHSEDGDGGVPEADAGPLPPFRIPPSPFPPSRV